MLNFIYFLKLCKKEPALLQYERFIALSLSAAISKELEKLPWVKIITASTVTQLIVNVRKIVREDDVNDNHS